MKAIHKKNPILKFIILAVMFVTTFSSCKKNDDLTSYTTIAQKGKPDPEKAKENALAQIQKLGGVPQIFNVIIPTQMFWIDKNKTKVDPTAQNNLVSACNWDYPTSLNLVQYARIFQCSINGTGSYRISYKYRLSWNNNVVLTNTTFNNQTTGTIYIRDKVTGDVDYSGIAYTDVSNLIDLGPDPNNSNNNIFEVNFISDESNLIPGFFIEGNTHTVSLGAEFATDCSNGDAGVSLWIVPVNGFGYNDDPTNDACKRNDKVFITPPGVGGNGTNILEVVSFQPANCYNSTFLVPHLSEIYYNIDGSVDWFPMSLSGSTYGLYIGTKYFPGDGYGVSGALPSGNHKIGLRYNNWRFNDPNDLGNVTPPTPFNACRYLGNGSSEESYYTYEYYNCIIP
jgi:hypothetical protein